MEYRFTLLIERLGARDVAEDSAEAMLDAFECVEPGVGAAVGADLAKGDLEVAFSVEAASPDEAWSAAERVFISAATRSGLQPTPVVAVDFEPIFGAGPRHSPSARDQASDTWSLPTLAHP